MDIAEIGFKAETSSLDKATNSLTKLKAAAAGVATATNKVDKAVTLASLSVARAKTSEAQAVLAALKATEKSSKVDIQKANQSLKVAKAEELKAKAFHNTAVAAERSASAMLKVVTAEKRQGSTRNEISLAAGGIANDNMPNRFNTANVAAQFQDIGVTAAMGMNPLTIALQQGTQLSAILNSMKNPLQGLAAAFTSIINPISLASIGIVALIAAGIQMVDWTKLAKKALNEVADVIQKIGPYAIGAAAGLAVLYSSSVISGLAALVKGIYSIGAAIVAVAAMPAVLIAGLAALTGAITVWAVNASKPFRKFANVVIGIIAGLTNMLVGQFIDLFEAVNNMVIIGLNKLFDLINTGISGIPDYLQDKLNLKPIEFRFKQTDFGQKQMEKGAGQLADSFSTAFGDKLVGTDYVKIIGTSVDGALDAASKKFREWSDAIGSDEKSPWQKLVQGAEKTIATLQAERDAFGMSAEAAAKLRYETELLNETKEKKVNAIKIKI